MHHLLASEMTEQADDQKLLLSHAGFVAKQVQVEDIHLVRVAAQRNFETDAPPPVIQMGFDVKSAWDRESKRIRVTVNFSLRAFYEGPERPQTAPLLVEVGFALSYALTSDDGIDDEKVDAFGKMNGVYNAWPYIRELVQSTLTRMSLPALTLPVLTSGLLTAIYRQEDLREAKSGDGDSAD
jgi:preprotein translocase subunit SecB